jgi:hypothetical protein
MTQLAGCERIIRKDERTKHLDKLIMEGEGMKLEQSSPVDSTKAR